jgi:DNA-binding GntR family transcriptional regulator
MAVTRTAFRDQVKEILLERILSGEYAPGERLVETRIARELGTSQGPVREALRVLETLRLIESEPFVGARVRAVSNEELTEIYPVRAALESGAARVAAVRLRGRVEPLERTVNAMYVAADEGDLHGQVTADVRFHRTIVEATGNSMFLEVWSSLGIETRTLITSLRLLTRAPGGFRLREIAALHEPIVEALRNQDPDEAATAARVHVETFGRLVEEGRA